MFIPEVLRANSIEAWCYGCLSGYFCFILFHLNYSGTFGAMNDRCTFSSKYCATSAVDVAVLTLKQAQRADALKISNWVY